MAVGTKYLEAAESLADMDDRDSGPTGQHPRVFGREHAVYQTKKHDLKCIMM